MRMIVPDEFHRHQLSLPLLRNSYAPLTAGGLAYLGPVHRHFATKANTTFKEAAEAASSSAGATSAAT